jgi:sodium/bile acid cotransporter 7
MAFFRQNWFPILLVVAFAGGFVLPGAGVALNQGSGATRALVVFIFLVTGYTMPTEALLRGVTDVKLHLYVEGFIFIGFPLYVFLTTWVLGDVFRPEVLAGLYALSVLPTTISSCTVFTQATGGNVAGTMFNAAFSNLVGVFLSPLLLSLLLQSAGRTLPMEQLGAIFLRLGLLMLAPTAAGQLLKRVYPGLAERKGKALRKSTSVAILLIVYFNVARAAGDDVFVSNLSSMGWPVVYLLASHLLLLAAAWGGARLLGFSREDERSAVFAAPQKTLALGAPLITIYFADQPRVLGIALLPVMLYHLIELLTAGMIRSRMAAE